jgi:hypothetical protein
MVVTQKVWRDTMSVPDIEFVVVLQPHTTAGRKWLAERMMPKNNMFSGAVVRSVECASHLGMRLWLPGCSYRAWLKFIRSRTRKIDPARV